MLEIHLRYVYDFPGGQNAMDVTIEEFKHPSWLTAVGTVAGYGVIIAIMTIVLFGLPWLVFASL